MATSDHATSAAASPSPSPGNKSQGHDRELPHVAGDTQSAAFLSLRGERAGSEGVEIDVAVIAPVKFGWVRGVGISE